MQAYTGVKTLYLESNAISTIENLSHMVDLRSLYLGKNIIHQIEHLQLLTNLETLDLSDNDISCIDNLAPLVRLKTLNISKNKCHSLDDIAHLSECPSITSLDLSGNKIADPAALDMLVEQPLSLLRFAGNPVVSSTT